MAWEKGVLKSVEEVESCLTETFHSPLFVIIFFTQMSYLNNTRTKHEFLLSLFSVKTQL